MLFNSLIFFLFSFLFFTFFGIVKKLNVRYAWIYIVFFSFVFYGWWDWRFIFLIIGSGVIDFFAGYAIHNKPKFKKLWLTLSIIGNLGSLAAFKYSKFLLTEIDSLFTRFDITLSLSNNLPEFLYILPVGISFYTFQSMSYTIDIYKGQLKPVKNIFHFFAYLSLFPQLVAGPIVRSKTLLPQLIKLKKTDEIERWHGLKLIAFGFFKKVFLADNIAPFVNTGFADINQTNSTLYWWLVMLGFAFQIYLDFSGYTDIARGLAKWMGFHFKMNFNHPYRSTSMREFWQRWHISLSTWFRDYLYVPLGGSKKGKLRSHLNMWITMAVSGFWHGASWNFIIWGWLHAIYMSIERLTKWPKFLSKNSLKPLAILLVMFQVLIAWVFFRAQTFSDAIVIIKNMLVFNTNIEFSINADVRNGLYYILFALLIEYIFIRFTIRKVFKNKKILLYLEPILMAILIAVSVFLRGKGQEFIYFQF